MSAESISAIMNCFRRTRKLTYDLLTELPEDIVNLHFPRPKLDTLGQQLAEMADVTLAYAKGIESGSLDFDTVRWDFPDELISSPERLKSYLRETDEAVEKAIAAADEDAEVDIYGEKASLLEVLIGLVQHETLHHGQLALFFHLNEVKMPTSWIEWMMVETAAGSMIDPENWTTC